LVEIKTAAAPRPGARSKQVLRYASPRKYRVYSRLKLHSTVRQSAPSSLQVAGSTGAPCCPHCLLWPAPDQRLMGNVHHLVAACVLASGDQPSIGQTFTTLSISAWLPSAGSSSARVARRRVSSMPSPGCTRRNRMRRTVSYHSHGRQSHNRLQRPQSRQPLG
jgi:hypothetical protein